MTMIETEMAESGPSTAWLTTSWHHLIKHGRWVSYLPHCCGEVPDKSNFRREELLLVYSLSIIVGKAGTWDGHSRLIFSQKAPYPRNCRKFFWIPSDNQWRTGKKKNMIQSALCDWIYQLRTKLRPSPWRIFHSQMIADSFWVLIWKSGKSYLDYQESFGLTLGAWKKARGHVRKYRVKGHFTLVVTGPV